MTMKIPSLRPDRREHRSIRLPPAECPSRALRLSPTAWAKLLYWRDLGETEVGGFGISSPRDLLLVQDVRLITQECSVATVSFQDEAVADFFDAEVDEGRKPEQFARIWVHTHPGDSPEPSSTDEETFARVFGGTDWAIMFIVAQGGQSYARLRFNVGPGGAMTIPVTVDYTQPFGASDYQAWAEEYDHCVHPLSNLPYCDPWEYISELAPPQWLLDSEIRHPLDREEFHDFP